MKTPPEKPPVFWKDPELWVESGFVIWDVIVWGFLGLALLSALWGCSSSPSGPGEVAPPSVAVYSTPPPDSLFATVPDLRADSVFFRLRIENGDCAGRIEQSRALVFHDSSLVARRDLRPALACSRASGQLLWAGEVVQNRTYDVRWLGVYVAPGGGRVRIRAREVTRPL